MKLRLIKQVTDYEHHIKEAPNLNPVYYGGESWKSLPDDDIAVEIETSEDEVIEVQGSRVVVRNKNWKEPYNEYHTKKVPWRR